MTQLKTVWIENWSALPGQVHVVLSSRDHVKAGRQLWRPTVQVMKRVFPTVFGTSLPEPDLNWLRDYASGRWEGHSLNSHEETVLRAAIDEAADWIIRIADLVPRFEKRITARELGKNSKRDGILSIVTPLAQSPVKVSDELIEELLAPFKHRAGEALTSAGVRSYLTDPTNTRRVETDLARRGMPIPPANADTILAEAERTLRDFLNAPELPQFVAPGKRHLPVTVPTVDKAWANVVTSQVDLWHWRARDCGLTNAQTPPLPTVSKPSRTSPLTSRAWLDSSLVDRLASALKTGAPSSTGGAPITMAQIVDAETTRATSHLGLSLTPSRALVALAAVIMGEYYDTPGQDDRDKLAESWKNDATLTAATKAIHRRVEQWRYKFRAFEGAATIPNQAVMHIAEPRTWYMSTVWRRAHTKEVQGDADFTPGYIWYLLTQLSTKTLHDIRARRWLESVGGVGVPADLEDQPQDGAESSVPDRWLLVLPRLKKAGIDSEEIRDFLRGEWGSDEHQKQWDEWMDLTGTSLSYEDLLAWWRRNEPE